MYPVVSWPLSSAIRKRPLRSDSVTSPSTSTFSSLTLIWLLSASRGDVGRLGALVALAGLVCDLRALGQALVARADNRAVVDDQVLAALVRLDEPVALPVVEPLHSYGCHETPPFHSHERVRKAKRATVERPKSHGRISGTASERGNTPSGGGRTGAGTPM